MDKSSPVTMEVGEDGIAIITISNPPVNVLTVSVFEGLKEKYKEAMRRNDVKAIVLTGENGKFSSGFNVRFVQKIQRNGDTSLLPDSSIDLVVNLIEGNKPSVAAIEGFAFGGGLELAMGCSARIASPKTQLGLPELKLGLIPGCGGTQRLPRLVGISRAIEMMLSSKPITSEEGKELGLIDALVSSKELLNVSRLWALDIAMGRRLHTNALQRTDKLRPSKEVYELLGIARQQALKVTPHMPHQLACLDVIEEGILSGGYSGVLKEDKVFRELVLSNTAKGLVHVFLAERAASKIPGVTDSGLRPRKIIEVAVIGGGLMGSGIATALILSRIHVQLKEINSDCLQRATKSIEVNLQGLIKRGELQQDGLEEALTFLTGVLDYEELKHVDMVIEAVNEEILLKQTIFEEIEKICPPSCILASNTSTIDLNIVGKKTRSQDRIVGAHLFSPAHLMPLLEIVRTEKTSTQVVLDLVTFAKTINKIPVVVRNCTGFAVNRTFFPYMQGADMLANLGVDIFRIDKVICTFGMPMGPFQLEDLTGYEIFMEAVKINAAAFPDRTFQSPLVALMVKNGRKGKKNGKGYYTYEKGSKPKPDLSVLSIIEESRKLTNIMPGGKPISVSDQEILEMILFAVVNEACRVMGEGVVVQASDLDMASVYGMKFPSYQGGIIFWADSVGPQYIHANLKKWSEVYGSFFKPSEFLEERAIKGMPLGAPVSA